MFARHADDDKFSNGGTYNTSAPSTGGTYKRITPTCTLSFSVLLVPGFCFSSKSLVVDQPEVLAAVHSKYCLSRCPGLRCDWPMGLEKSAGPVEKPLGPSEKPPGPVEKPPGPVEKPPPVNPLAAAKTLDGNPPAPTSCE